MPFPRILESITVGLDTCQIAIFKNNKNESFKDAWFSKISFFQKKGPWKCAISLLNQIVKISLLSQIIRLQVNAPFRDFLTVITNFLGALSQKEDDFSWIINQVLRIFWFQTLRKSRFENKGNFWIKCVCIKTFMSWHPYKKHLHHDMPIRRHSHH